MYAPFSGVGGIVYDKDAVYIDLGPNHPLRPEGAEVNIARKQNNQDLDIY